MVHRIPMDVTAFLALTAVPIITLVAIHLPDIRAGQKDDATRAVGEISEGLLRYRCRGGGCPATRDDLLARGHITRRALTDPWRNSIAYRCFQGGAHVRSAGRDGIFNTRDDIVDSFSWNGAQVELFCH